jgi:hypothetical protein
MVCACTHILLLGLVKQQQKKYDERNLSQSRVNEESLTLRLNACEVPQQMESTLSGEIFLFLHCNQIVALAYVWIEIHLGIFHRKRQQAEEKKSFVIERFYLWNSPTTIQSKSLLFSMHINELNPFYVMTPPRACKKLKKAEDEHGGDVVHAITILDSKGC